MAPVTILQLWPPRASCSACSSVAWAGVWIWRAALAALFVVALVRLVDEARFLIR